MSGADAVTIADAAPPDATPHVAAPGPASARTHLMVAGATTLAFVLGMFQLGKDSFWVDDGFTAAHAGLPNSDFWHVITNQEMNGALYSVLMHGWVQLSDGEAWMRFPSVVFVTAAVPLLFVLGKRLFDERVALTASFLLAINAFVIEFAHEGRTYAFTLLLTVASITLLVRYLDHPSRPRWWAWVLCTGLLPLAHFFGMLIIGAEVVMVLSRRSLPTPKRALVGGFAVIGVFLLPIAWFLASGGDKGQVSTAPSLTPVRFVGVFSRLVGNGGPVLLVVVGIAIASALWHGGERILTARGVHTEAAWGFVVTVAWAAVPVVTMTALALVKPLFGARYFLLITPALVLLASAGVWELKRRPVVAKGLLATIVVGSLVSTAFFYPRAPHDEFRAMTNDLLTQAEPGDGVIFVPWFTRIVTTVYADRHPDARDQLVPLEPEPDWGDWLLIDQPPTVTPERADALLEGHDRIWLVERAGTDETPQSGDQAVFTEALDRNGFTRSEHSTYSGLGLALYTHP
jgi:mannosyltransferase